MRGRGLKLALGLEAAEEGFGGFADGGVGLFVEKSCWNRAAANIHS